MNIYSTWYHGNDVSPLDEDILTSEFRRATDISIVSAYYSTNFIYTILEKIFKNKRKLCNINCVFNGFGGEKLSEQISELKELKNELLRIGFENINIYVNRECQLFHTKLYYIKNENSSLWVMGSANASKSGFNSNEELLIKSTTNLRGIKSYINCVIVNSEKIEDISISEIVENNLIGFFRTGSIYFKPTNQLSFTFGELNNCLPKDVADRLGNINERPRNSNPGKAWGPYNLKKVLDIKDDGDENSSRLRIKPWSIETCYGYWVPKKYCSYIEAKLKDKETELESHFVEIVNKISSVGEDRLLDDFNQYLSEANEILARNDIPFNIDKKLKESLIKKYQTFIKRIENKINDPKKRKRLCTPLISTGMPEIWEDSSAEDDFSYSFYEYISGSLSSSNTNTPLIISSLNYYLEFSESADVEEIKQAFEDYFNSEDAEWSDDYWFDKKS
jgi:hypothetical protein